MDKYKITFQTWNKIAAIYQEMFMDLDLYDDSYDAFCNAIKKQDAAVLEIGCGPGNITRYLLAKRPDFRVKGIDVAPEMVKLAEANNPQADFDVMDCRELDQLTGRFDAIICGFCLPYLSKTDFKKLVKDCYSLLNAGGVLYLSAIEGDYAVSGYQARSNGDKIYVYFYEMEFLQRNLQESGFKPIAVMRKLYEKSSGVEEAHLILLVGK